MKLDTSELGCGMRNKNDGRVYLFMTDPTAIRTSDGRWVFGTDADKLCPGPPNMLANWPMLPFEDTADLLAEAELAAAEAKLPDQWDPSSGPIVRAISVRQPYVEQILLGKKKFEFRSRPTRHRERVYLYASATPADDQMAWNELRMTPGALPTKCILGSVEIVACLNRDDVPDEEYAYVLRNPERLTNPLFPLNQPLPAFWRPKFR